MLIKERKENNMNTKEKIYLTATDIAEMLGCSIGFSYKLIRGMNKSLSEQGYITIAGKIPVKYFKEKYYGFDD